jgi:hypothetical protein
MLDDINFSNYLYLKIRRLIKPKLILLAILYECETRPLIPAVGKEIEGSLSIGS